MKLTFSDLHASLGGQEILRGTSLTAEHGQVTGIVGPNGCGKSTLIKTLFGIVRRQSGEILLGDTPRDTLSAREVAARVGYVGQDNASVFDFTVYDVVAMALYQKKRPSAGRRSQRETIFSALRQLRIEDMADRSITTLSGGERKLVFIARAIAQEVDTIVLDEPTNHLDIQHQLFLLDYLRRSGKTILVVLHDLNLASYYCDSLALMQDGRVLAQGSPPAVLTEENVLRVFGVRGHAQAEPDGCKFALQLQYEPLLRSQ